jgi:hypothetical protein
MGCKKKLYKCRPRDDRQTPAFPVEAQCTRARVKPMDCDPRSLERGVRQLLADKVSGHLVGLWLLVAEHLRFGTWDLLRAWSRQPTERVEPRLALQLVHEAVLCTTGIRADRTLTNRGGFELAAGLPFVARDVSIHLLLAEHTVADAVRLQVALGQLRRASGDFQGELLAVDPHRVRSYSKRQFRKHAKNASERPCKMAQTFWLLDADTCQPVCFVMGTASRTVAQVMPELLNLAAEILGPWERSRLVLADTEHRGTELIDHVARRPGFDLLLPMASTAVLRRQLQMLPADAFTPRWAGFATLKQRYMPNRSQAGPYHQLVQRSGERPDEWQYKAFLATADREEVDALTREFPKRWHIEEFFNLDQPLGWQRAGTLNLHIRYGQMTMALIGQALLHGLRGRLGAPISGWDANHLSKDLLQGLDGDVRVTHDTIIVTYYNAPHAERLREHYEGLPDKLAAEHIDPRVPWLYGFKLDFRFR